MAALQGIGVLVERGAVEMAEAMGIVGKMSGHPVEPHGNAFAMAGFDQRGKILRAAEPAGRRVQAGRLIAPGAVEGMFADGEKLDMREAEIPHIGRKLLGQLTIGQPFIVALAPPRAEMDLVDRDRRAQRVQAVGAGCGRGNLASSKTIEAVFGRTSVAKANGSDFSGRCWPFGSMISNL